MASGFRDSNGTDTDDLFDYAGAGAPAPGITTGFRMSDGAELGSRYAAVAYGSARAANTGLRMSNGDDLRLKFAAKGTVTYDDGTGGGGILK